MQLRFSPFSGCNDSFEFYKVINIKFNHDKSIRTMNKLSNEFRKQIEKYSLICFSQEVDIRGIKGWQLPTMWAHYGDKHNGVCLEFDFEPSLLSQYGEHLSVEYVESMPKIKPFDKSPLEFEDEWIECTIGDHIEELKLITFFKKLYDWGFENEYRIIQKKNDYEDSFLPITDSLKTVYLGFKASGESVNSIKAKILQNLLDEKGIILKILDDEILSSTNFCDLRFVATENEKMVDRLRISK